MIFNYSFSHNSNVIHSEKNTSLNFAPDMKRGRVSFLGTLIKKLAFREAISALHDVVVSDFRFYPKDKTIYKQWLAENEKMLLAKFVSGINVDAINIRAKEIRKELNELYAEKASIMKPYYNARSQYFDYLYKTNREAWIVLDPIITVHPDCLFFECFSQDESAYAKLSLSHNVFKSMGEISYGTTNIDYSSSLYNEFQKIRSYKETTLNVIPEGVNVKTTNDDVYHEKKIDLPDSWMKGFLQVSTAMALPGYSFDIHPMDLYSLCSLLKRFKEKTGPRAIRFILDPGKPIKIVFEPWFKEITFNRSIYKGVEANTIRVWGRRRINLLERLIPVCQKITVKLTGNGLPYYFICKIDDMEFTLGLSGWTANDWSQAGKFDLLAPISTYNFQLQQKVYSHLSNQYMGSSEQIASTLHENQKEVTASLTSLIQSGKVIYDLSSNLYRFRELTSEPINLTKIRFSGEVEREANNFIEKNNIDVSHTLNGELMTLSGHIKTQNFSEKCTLDIDRDGRIVNARCSCSFYLSNKLRKGPCSHVLASRMFYEIKKHQHQLN